MDKNKVLKILETAKDENGEVPMRLVRQAFEKLPEHCEDAVSRRRLLNDLKELIAAWEKYPVMTEQIKGVETAIGYVEKIPSVTPKRKTGRWVFHRPPDDWVLSLFTCDQCGHMNEGEPRYCPGCGAKMDGSE